MAIKFETERYAYHYDGLYGVGRFRRKEDDALTLMDTGTACEELMESLEQAIANAGDEWPAAFDAIASEQEYHA